MSPQALKRTVLAAALAALGTHTAHSQQSLTDFASAGNIRLAVSSYGTIGNGFGQWPRLPSAEYPRGSAIENLFSGGLWIGGITTVNGSRLTAVSSAAVDVSSVVAVAEGFEFTNAPGTGLVRRSSLVDDPYFTPEAISHLDLISTFSDTSLVVPELNSRIPNHNTPLGVQVRQEIYSWNYPFADFFVILNFTIKNISAAPLDSLYIGHWDDVVIRNTNVRAPRGSDFFAAGGSGFLTEQRAMYEWDAAGDNGLADNYAGIMILGSEPRTDTTFFNSWQFRNATGDGWTQSPQNDIDKYSRLTSSFANQLSPAQAKTQLAIASNRSQLLSTGPFPRLMPGDSITIAFAFVASKKSGAPRTDTDEQRQPFLNNMGWAQRAYNGTDANGNGQLDSNEVDLRGDGSIVRYVLPTPPAPPKMRVETDRNTATVYWSNSSEGSIDLLTRRKNFEGYRLYRSQPTTSFGSADTLTPAGAWDTPGNGIGLDNGFDDIRILDAEGNPTTKMFDGDTVVYRYAKQFSGISDGFVYSFALTAFSNGDAANGVPPLESSILANTKRIIPGPEATSQNTVGVFPNPYYVSAAWDKTSNVERGRKIYFTGLPRRATIRIFTMSGDMVASLTHEPGMQGQDIEWFRQSGYGDDRPVEMAGGIHAWDIITDADQAPASGLYIAVVEDRDTGASQKIRFAVLK